MTTTYGYARCSTDESRQDIDRQKRDLLALGVEDASHIYWEYASGTKADRPELQKLLTIVQPGDTIAATEVSRLTRSTQQLCKIVELVQERRLRLVIGSFVVDCTSEDIDPMTKGMLMMWGVFSEMERDIISARVKSGMDNAKAKGKKIGRPVLTADAIPSTFWKHYATYTAGKLNKSEFARLLGVTRQTLYRWLEIAKKTA